MRLVRCEPEKVYQFQPDEEIIISGDTSYCIEITDGPASGMLGVTRDWSGVGTAWAYMGDIFKNTHPFTLTRGVRTELENAMRELELRRVQAVVAVEYVDYWRWLKVMGFKLEARLHLFMPTGSDGYMMAYFRRGEH